MNSQLHCAQYKWTFTYPDIILIYLIKQNRKNKIISHHVGKEYNTETENLYHHFFQANHQKATVKFYLSCQLHLCVNRCDCCILPGNDKRTVWDCLNHWCSGYWWIQEEYKVWIPSLTIFFSICCSFWGHKSANSFAVGVPRLGNPGSATAGAESIE